MRGRNKVRDMKRILTVASLLFCLTANGQTKEDGMLVDSLQEVVVTGTGTKHLLRTAPVQTEVITHRDLEQYGGRSIEDILSGLSASFAFSEDDMGSQMQMNGLGNSYILILVDGKRLHGDNGGQNDLGQINPARIERIEIVKGAASALYGSDAIAGVINIITRKPQRGIQLENNTRGGSYGDFRQHNGIGLTLGPVQSYTNFHFRHSDGWQNTGEEDPTQIGGKIITDSRNKTVNRNELWQLSERLSWNPIKDMEVYAEGMLYHKRIYRPNGKYAVVDVHGYDLSYNDEALSAGWSWQLKGGHLLSADISYNRHAYYYDYTFEGGWLVETGMKSYPYLIYFDGDRVLQSDQRRTLTQLKGVFQLPHENRLSVGYDYRYDELEAPMRIDVNKVTDWTQAVYAQDEWHPLHNLNFTAGLRLDHNRQFGLHLTPKLSSMLQLGDFTLRASWSQGFKSPTLKELRYRYVREMGGVRLYLGNRDLKPQTSNYYMLSGEYNIRNFMVNVTGYYNKVDNMINLITIPKTQAPGDLLLQYQPSFVRQYQNMEDAYTAGMDVNVKWNASKEITLGGGYSLLYAEGNFYNEKTDELQRITIEGTARHKTNVFATWNHRFSRNYQLGVGIYGRASSTRFYQDYGNGKGYQLWRLSTTHNIGHSKLTTWRAEAGIDNIFNYVDRTPHLRHLGTTTPGTTVYASLIIRFHYGKNTKYNKHYSTLKSNHNEEN